MMSTKFGEVISKICFVQSPIESIACTSDSQRLIVGQVATYEDTPTLSIVDINTGNIDRIIEKSDNIENSIWRLVIDKKDGYVIYLKQYEGNRQIIIYNMKTNEKRTILETEDIYKYKGFIVSPRNELVIGDDNVISFWSIEEARKFREIKIGEPKTIVDLHCYTSLAFSSDDVLAIGGLNKGEVLLYDLQKEKIINRLSAKFSYPGKIIFDPTGKYIFVLDYWTKGIFIWNLQTDNWHMKDIFSENWPHVTSVDFYKKDPRKVVMGSLNSFIVMLDFEELEETFSDGAHQGRIYDVLFTPDGKRLISSGEDWHIIVRNAE